jgi:ceramide glucosyltransferase
MNLPEILSFLGGGALLVAGVGVFFDALALLGADRLLKSRPDAWVPDSALPPILMIKPVRGLDHGARENYLSFVHQHYPHYRIVFTVDSADDPSVGLIRELEALYPEKVSLSVVSERSGVNRKMNKVASVARGFSDPYVLLNDSDIRVESNYLREIVTPMISDKKVGAVTCLQRGNPEGGFTSRLSALLLNSEMIPQALVAYMLMPLSYLYGPTMLFRGDAIRAIGGFDVMKDYLADDYHLGRLIHEKGYRIVLSPTLVDAQIKDEPLSDILAHEIRWARTYSSLRPVGYGLSILARPFVFCLLAFIAGIFSRNPAISTAAIGLYILHVALSYHLMTQFLDRSLTHRDAGLWLMREIVSLFSYLSSFGRRVKWRGHRYRILPGGALKALDMPDGIAPEVSASSRSGSLKH